MPQTHTERITVALRAQDPVSQAGVASQLRARGEIKVIKWDEDNPPHVLIAVLDIVDDDALRLLRQIRQTTTARGVLVATHIDEHQLVKAAECGFAGVVRRSEATPERLVQVIGSVAKGEGQVPADLLGNLLDRVGKLQEHGLVITGLLDREKDVMRLLAEGFSTAETAAKLSCSERTVKNILHDVMVCFGSRNRLHAVAYAIRQGFI
ncbi:LuxR C-terminal-related transcriptional regulator [Streptomyces sp. NPDC004629]|uniref:helix-turn-helix transcriptional regulator n=1 Tax=Streptomyces sp. NPDC004629 TaxID=3364705 RepID=UPI00367524FD